MLLITVKLSTYLTSEKKNPVQACLASSEIQDKQRFHSLFIGLWLNLLMKQGLTSTLGKNVLVYKYNATEDFYSAFSNNC